MSSNSGKMMVNKVSPAEQMVQMAEKQLKKKHRGVYKRKKSSSRVHSSKRRRMGCIRKTKKRKAVKSKKGVKKNARVKNKRRATIQDILN